MIILGLLALQPAAATGPPPVELHAMLLVQAANTESRLAALGVTYAARHPERQAQAARLERLRAALEQLGPPTGAVRARATEQLVPLVSGALQTVAELQTRYGAQHPALRAAEARARTLRSHLDRDAPAAPGHATDDSIHVLLEMRARLRARHTMAAARLGPRHPQVVGLTRTLSSLDARVTAHGPLSAEQRRAAALAMIAAAKRVAPTHAGDDHVATLADHEADALLLDALELYPEPATR